MTPTFTFSSEAAAEGEMVLLCDLCGEQVLAVEEGDDLEIITRCALDHAEECVAPSESATTSRERP